ncbi:MAG: hypothetical protein LUH22_06930, partial [Bacteroides sp.]|nr:hypothetical protein [Bacteroides sp.]
MENKNLYIKKIIIKKLFGFKDIEWNLFDDVNILGGKNGSGKSTVIKIAYDLIVRHDIYKYAHLFESVYIY